MNKLKERTYHNYLDTNVLPYTLIKGKVNTGVKYEVKHFSIVERELNYRFFSHFHPYVTRLVKELIEGSIPGLQAIDTAYKQKDDGTYELLDNGNKKPLLYEDIFSESRYKPSELVKTPYPVKELDFSSSGAYSVYNWELFFHVPLSIAINLSKNQRYEEAQQWFHNVFDPTDNSDDPTPERFWRVKPFQTTDIESIEDILINLATGDDPELQERTINCINAWKNDPFRPHLIARYRQSAYMYKTVMAYLDNLISWGDSLFRQDTRESINEATQIYVLASGILGPKPQVIPRSGSRKAKTYKDLRSELDEFGNALVDLETEIPFDVVPHPASSSGSEAYRTIRSIGQTLYFGVPSNEKILDYWTTVADRLYKIRNSLNIMGIFRQLPLFEPPIDPALLAKAAAAGLDIGAVISGLNQPLPLIRFRSIVQKAMELCQEVKALGNSLLSVIEKEDNEALAVLRAKHESVILGLVKTVKYGQYQEAVKSYEGLLKSFENVKQHYIYYERLLGEDEEEVKKKILDLDALDVNALGKMKLNMKEPEMGLREIEVDIAQDLSESGGKIISSHEFEEFTQLKAAQELQEEGASMNLLAKFLSLIPEFEAEALPIGLGAAIQFGGRALSTMLSMAADSSSSSANRCSYEANKAAKIGSYARREQEWAFQSNLAAGEITQIYKQLRAAEIRKAIAELELKNHQEQIKNAEEINQFLKGEEISIGDKKHKKTSIQPFYAWMKREVKGLYSQCFQFAFDIAKKAERALQHELGNMNLNYVQFNYLAGREGLLAGEKMYLDLKRMEMAYHELNQREYELIKHASLLQVDPEEILRLRVTGNCTVSIPEELFDMDCPGHYFRRIKTVAVSIPCVTGPYTNINCKLTLLKSTIRKNTLLADNENGYARANSEDNRFDDNYGYLQAIVTSTGQNDSGLFETNMNDERYLPFEGSGVESQWRLELPAEIRQFNYDTISDVILHIRYTAREGGDLLKKAAVSNLNIKISEARAVGCVRFFSIRHEFPTEWSNFKTNKNMPFELTLNLRNEHYPFWSNGRVDVLKQVSFFAKPVKDTEPTIVVYNKQKDEPKGSRKEDNLVKDPSIGDLRVGKLMNIQLPDPVGKFSLYINYNTMDDLWMAVTWGK